MFGIALIGSIIAGSYGIVHDQITYLIGPEYFTKFKFQQFYYADFGFGERVFVGCIGFLATWWVGFIVAWFLARRLIPNQSRKLAYRGIFQGFAIVFLCGMLFGVGGYAFGLWQGPDADYSAWAGILNQYNISCERLFVRVAYIHNASYLGGFIGFVIALFVIRPKIGDQLDNRNHDSSQPTGG